VKQGQKNFNGIITISKFDLILFRSFRLKIGAFKFQMSYLQNSHFSVYKLFTVGQTEYFLKKFIFANIQLDKFPATAVLRLSRL